MKRISLLVIVMLAVLNNRSNAQFSRYIVKPKACLVKLLLTTTCVSTGK